MNVKLTAASQNLATFYKATNFQKTILSILSGLMVQQEELKDLKSLFIKMDTNKDGTLSKEELRNGLQNVTMFELF